MRVLFRVDASVVIGIGHVMRCLTLAKALQARGAQVVFVCRELDGHQIDRIQRDFTVLRLPAAYQGETSALTPESSVRRRQISLLCSPWSARCILIGVCWITMDWVLGGSSR